MVFDMNYCNKIIKKIIMLGISIIAIYLSFKLVVFYMPFLIAFIISLLIEPLIKFAMKKLKFKRKLSAILIISIVLILLISLIIWGISTIISEASTMLQNLNIYFEKISEQIQNVISKFNFEKLLFLENFTGNILISLSNWAQKFLTYIINTLTSLPTIALYIVITILAIYFICIDKIYMLDQLEHHLPQIWVKKIGKHLKKLIKTLGGYLKAQGILTIISFAILVISFYCFVWCGLNIKYPLITAVLIALIDALPIFGCGTILIPWAIISAFDGNFKLGVVLLVLWLILAIMRRVLEPKIVSNQIGTHPIFTLIAMYTGFKLSGIIGIFIGPIILIILKNIFETTIDKGFIKCILEKN